MNDNASVLALFFSVLALVASVGTLVLHSERIGEIEGHSNDEMALLLCSHRWFEDVSVIHEDAELAVACLESYKKNGIVP